MAAGEVSPQATPHPLCFGWQLQPPLQLLLKPPSGQAVLPLREHPLQVTHDGRLQSAPQPRHVPDLRRQPAPGVLPR